MKRNKTPKWIPLNLYLNCFDDDNHSHLGFKYKGVHYCITHNKGSEKTLDKDWIQGYLIPKSALKMSVISPKKEYLKQCLTKPTLLNKTGMFINYKFVTNTLRNKMHINDTFKTEMWWGYLHISGTIHVKRYFDDRDIDDAEESDFVKYIMGPYEAKGREDAITKFKNKFNLN